MKAAKKQAELAMFTPNTDGVAPSITIHLNNKVQFMVSFSCFSIRQKYETLHFKSYTIYVLGLRYYLSLHQRQYTNCNLLFSFFSCLSPPS